MARSYQCIYPRIECTALKDTNSSRTNNKSLAKASRKFSSKIMKERNVRDDENCLDETLHLNVNKKRNAIIPLHLVLSPSSSLA